MVVYMLHNIGKHVEAFDFTKVFEIPEEVKKYQIPGKYESTVEQLEVLMEDLSVDEIKTLLGEVFKEENS